MDKPKFNHFNGEKFAHAATPKPAVAEVAVAEIIEEPVKKGFLSKVGSFATSNLGLASLAVMVGAAIGSAVTYCCLKKTNDEDPEEVESVEEADNE